MAITKDEEIIARGYSPYPQIIKPSLELVNLANILSKLPISITNYPVHQMSLKDATYDTQAFLNEYYNLHKIPYIKIRKNGKYSIKNIHPYYLPLYGIKDESIFSGSVIEEIIRKTSTHICFGGINLCQTVTEQTSSSYTHELTHTQLDHQLGIIKEYYNSEVLSIFNELFHASLLDQDERILRLNDSRRIYEIKTIIDSLCTNNNSREDSLIDSLYLVSNLKCYNLFVTFYYGSSSIKKEIIRDIQSIFDGYMTVEELLTKYDITFESSLNEKRLIKYFNR